MTENKNNTEKNSRQIRQARARSLGIKFGIFVIVPTIISAVYFGLIASNVYMSQSSFSVQSADSQRPSIGLDAIIGGISTGSTKDSYAVKDYILSRDMLFKLNKEHDFIKHYKNFKADYFSRLKKDSTMEESFEYYLDVVIVEYNTVSGIVTLKVKAFTAERARTFAKSIVSYSEKMVNKLSERARHDRIRYAKTELNDAEQRLSEARKSVLKLQRENAEFHPGKSAVSLMNVRQGLETELAKSRAELSQAMSVMHASAPKVVALRQKVRALSKQIEKENERLVGKKGSGISSSIADFESAIMEKSFAEKEYQSAMASFEIAKMESARQNRYLATISAPSQPDDATHPKRFLKILTSFFVCLAIFGIGSLFVSAIREHARI